MKTMLTLYIDTEIKLLALDKYKGILSKKFEDFLRADLDLDDKSLKSNDISDKQRLQAASAVHKSKALAADIELKRLEEEEAEKRSHIVRL